MLSIPFGALKMFFSGVLTKKKKKRGKMCPSTWFHCENVFFISSWIDSFKALLPSEWNKQHAYFCVLPRKREKKKPNNSPSVAQPKHFFVFYGSFFFFFSLATVANNFIICIALIAVIKQTQRTPTLRRASSQPRSQLRLCFFPQGGREGGWGGFVLGWKEITSVFFLLFLFFIIYLFPPPLQTVSAADVEQE